ncbi:MAG: hypothetical protein COC19_01700 [SAR86 cluster bacterium]|uniref:DUF924 domain-containing protein n=1 Tax=SAR86 cluster bacterium TaxID=2030880 RepID=A0A2A4MTN0_9GAMM|nr:MAG: hypothetical protein COC19_01700 [SAR86 cluster bacterium]
MPWHQVIDFWFEETSPQQRFTKDLSFDRLIISRFLKLHGKAVCGELTNWRETASGALAEIILLDQFSRNMFRDTAKAFAFDDLALDLAQQAIAKGFDTQLNKESKTFFYMPFTHSESAQCHVLAADLFAKEGMEVNLRFELRHKAIIERFGRYPHRNKILHRQSTDEELIFLQQPGSSF